MDYVRTPIMMCVTACVSAAAVLVFARFAPSLGLVDVPGGRKDHANPVPVVGGLAIFFAVLSVISLSGAASDVGYFITALSTVIAIGLWDDVRDISPRLKFTIQVVASSIMIWGANIELRSVGDLLGVRPIGLWFFVVPATIFAVVGVVNAINMMDGMDGLAGSTSLTALSWFAVVAADTGLNTQLNTALLICCALAGFLIFNLRLPWQPQARVFLGDAGSLMLGFALGWFAIDLTQGPGRAFPPIGAVWVLLLPLVDCVSVMSRRISRGSSPFRADRQHVHHYLLARGFTHTQTVAILVGLSAVFGAVGYFGWRLHIPESALFYPFFFGFFVYHFVMCRAWRRLEHQLRTKANTAPTVVDPQEREATGIV